MLRRFARIGVAIGGGILGMAAVGGMLAHPIRPILAMQPTVQPTAEPPSLPSPAPQVNKEVEPGTIRWHPNLDAALIAAKASHKPVLVFHMMGRLDQQFC